jgi:hypothetical protein
MPRIILTARVEDAQTWKVGFQTHGDLFRALGVTVTHYTVTDDNEIALYEEIDDLDRYFAMLQEAPTLEAMASDGVIPGSVKVFVLDTEWSA